MEWNKKLAEYQATPPPPAWNEIENTLRQDKSSLYHHTAVPPNESWEAISTKLSSLEKKQSSPSFNWLRPALRYAAMIAFLALATTTLINSSFRNALIETIQGPGIKAALSDTPQIIHLDSNKNKIQIKPLSR
ncbi:MAG: hypothetical protein RJB31_760 [Bacteroidota bacterium]